MTGDDWQDGGLRTIGMFVSGDPIRSPGPRGEQIRDTGFLLWLKASPEEQHVVLPENQWVHRGTVVLSTDPDNPVDTLAVAGESLVLAARTNRLSSNQFPSASGIWKRGCDERKRKGCGALAE